MDCSYSYGLVFMSPVGLGWFCCSCRCSASSWRILLLAFNSAISL